MGTETMFDVIVVGSGASAVHAALPMVESGLRVLMIDVANRDSVYQPLIPNKRFEAIRRTDDDQHRYFLGDRFEGIPFGDVRVGAQLTPPRQHITRDTGQWLPADTGDFQAMQSLALGGLGAGWGASCMPFSDEEMRDWPINRGQLQPHYEAVAREVGISGTNHDDLVRYFGRVESYQSPTQMDSNGMGLIAAYQRHKDELNRRGFHMGAPRLAITSEGVGDRGPTRYQDMEFWSDADGGVYRPRFTVDRLQRWDNFTFEPGTLAESFKEISPGLVEVHVLRTALGTRETLTAARLVLGAGAIGSARIALRSFRSYGVRRPMVSNPYTYFPCMHWRRLGMAIRDQRHSLTQVAALFDPDQSGERPISAQAYSYRSLLTFKLVKESPLPHPVSIRLMQLLQPYFVIVGVHHEDRPASSKAMWLEKPADDDAQPLLKIDYAPTPAETARRSAGEKELMACFAKLGCRAMKRIDPGEGSSIHYGGTLPMTAGGSDLFTTRPDGRLRGTKTVYVADGAAFPHLPAKGLTYTLMANARRVGMGLATGFSS